MAKVLVAISPFEGHVGPLLTIAGDLVRRGHEVLVHTGARFAERVERSGAKFVPLPEKIDYDDRNLVASFPDLAHLPGGPAQIAYLVMHVFGDPVPVQYASLRRLLEDFPAAFLIHEMQFMGALPIAIEKLDGVPPTIISIGIQPPVFESEYAHPYGAVLLPVEGEDGRAQHMAMNQQARLMSADMEHYMRNLFVETGTSLNDLVFNTTVSAPDHYLQLTVPGFEYPRPDAPASYRFVGALNPHVSSDVVLPAWWEEVSTGRPVITVTQGTLDNRDFSNLILPTIRALAERDITVVVATARPDGPDDVRDKIPQLPGNVLLGGFIPFDRLLPLTDILITNGGYGGVHTALRHGVPLIVAADGQDKPEVAARVEWSGAGVNLRSGRPSEEELRAAIERILNEPSYRTRAKALQAELAAYDPLDEIAEIVGGQRPQR